MDTQRQNFWVESINKEAAVRFAWHLKYSKKFAKKAIKQQSDAARKSKAVPISNNSAISQQIKRMESEERRELEAAEETAPKSPTTKPSEVKKFNEMKPVPRKIMSLLYDGISHHGEGRYAYLRARKGVAPEDKFEYPVLTSCQYGWRLGDHGLPTTSPFARTSIVRDTFFRYSGIIVG